MDNNGKTKILILTITAATLLAACDVQHTDNSKAPEYAASTSVPGDIREPDVTTVPAEEEEPSVTTVPSAEELKNPVTTPKPATTTKKPATTTKKPAVTTAKPATTTKPAATTAKPSAATTSYSTSGLNRTMSAQLLTLTNKYKTANGLSASTSSGGWQLYADRLVKLMAENGYSQHGPGVYEIVTGAAINETPQMILNKFINSPGHKACLLNKSMGKYIAVSVYTRSDADWQKAWSGSTGDGARHYVVIVLMDRTYQQYYNTYGMADSDERWWEGSGTWDDDDDNWLLQAQTWTPEQDKQYFQSHNYSQYYPHLK